METACDRIFIVCTYNDSDAEIDYTKAIWTSIVEYWESQDMILELMGDEAGEKCRHKSQFCFSNCDIDTYYAQLVNMYHFMCYRRIFIWK